MLSSWAAWAPAREVEDVLAHGLIRDVETYLRTTFAGAFDGYPWAVGGWLAAELGHIPRRGETLSHEGLQITVVGADGKRALWLHVQRNPAPQPESPGDGPIIDA